jgi:hypothetical protein
MRGIRRGRASRLGVEWRFPRVLGTNRTWNERILFVMVAARFE